MQTSFKGVDDHTPSLLSTASGFVFARSVHAHTYTHLHIKHAHM